MLGQQVPGGLHASVRAAGSWTRSASWPEPLEGKRVLHVSATAFGGGVSEILYTLVPLMRDVGLDTSWQIIMGREEFFNATKLLHNSLQGDPNSLSPNQWELFDHYNKMNAESLEGEWDYVIVHDPQPVGMKKDAEEHGKHWIWRCHIDLSEPNPDPIERLLPLISGYDASVWHLEQYVPAGLNGHGGVKIVPPGDRPAVAEEHGAVGRRRLLRLRPVRDRRGPPPADPGLAASTPGRTRWA